MAVSKPAELFQKLSTLKSSDPASFKQVTNRLAELFAQRADSAEGSERTALSKLASRFASAAQTGDVSALKPAGHPSLAPPAPPPVPARASIATPADPLATAFSIVDSLAPAGSSEDASAFQKLTDLKAASPAGFKQLMNRVAEQLSQLSNFAEGSEKDGLSALASSFANAAETGDISAFKPASSEPAPVPPAPPPPAPPAAPVVAPIDTAFSIVDSLAPTGSSEGASAFQKLTDLKAASPAGFKQLMNRVAERLGQLSNFAEGGEKEGLSALASSFASAAETGDISAFKPASTEPAPVPPAPPPPPPAAPVVAPIDTAFSIVDSLAPAGSSAGASAFQKLTDLKAASPAGFKQLMNRVAEQLSQLSNFAEGSEKDGLSALAGSFASAAETGDISAFKPASSEPASVPPAPPPPPPAAAPAVDPRDTAFAIVDSLTPSSAGTSSDPLDKLSDLKTSSPAAFKQVMNHVAERLSQLSNFAEGDERDGLSALASKFASAAESGDLSALKPTPSSSEPAPVETPSAQNEQAPAQGAFERWRCGGHATASYLRQCQPAPRAMDEAYGSALNLFDSLTTPASA